MSMRIQTFETIMIFAQDFTTGGYEKKVSEWKDILKGLPAAKIRTERIGRKKLAYETKGNTHGWYVLFKYESTEDLIHSKLDLRLRQDDDVIKFLTTNIQEDYLPDDYEASEQPDHSDAKPVDVFDLIFDTNDTPLTND